MKSFEHFTRSKALKSRVSLDTASDVEPDDVTPESGKFGHRKVASQGCEGAGVPAAAASRGPFCTRPGGGWKWRRVPWSPSRGGLPGCSQRPYGSSSYRTGKADVFPAKF